MQPSEVFLDELCLLGCEAVLSLQLYYVSLQRSAASEAEKDAGDQTTEKRVLYAPIVVARATNLLIEGLVTDECTLCQLKVEVSGYLQLLLAKTCICGHVVC